MSQHTDELYVINMRDACAKVERYIQGFDLLSFQGDERTNAAGSNTRIGS